MGAVIINVIKVVIRRILPIGVVPVLLSCCLYTVYKVASKIDKDKHTESGSGVSNIRDHNNADRGDMVQAPKAKGDVTPN